MTDDNDHWALGHVTLTPRHDNAEVFFKTEYEDDGPSYTTIKFRTTDIDYKTELVFTKNKQKLIDAGFSSKKANKILDALGLQ